ncbi:latexin [Takifugu rubripes]|uniref:latexin n=1 Tax=Takifugu rubripes TaxID=31033 RepID=UPI0005D18DA7|nr:latexin [Takifugu rubripes]|eukprot:XP_011606666.1 PREDICTED: latexin isoform X1 [Takifugu rubripes]
MTMSLRIIFALVVISGVTGDNNVTTTTPTDAADGPSQPDSLLGSAEKTHVSGEKVLKEDEAEEHLMASGELNPNHYPAQRAAKVVQHYLTAHYGSPYRLFGLQKVFSGNAQDTADSGRKYQLELLVHELISNATENCSAEVFFAKGEERTPAQVEVSCKELIKNNTLDQEEALFQQYKTNQSLLSAHDLPDRYGHMEPDTKPLWHLGIVASSFVMLNESTEDTLYNMAQVANITQLQSDDDVIKFESLVLLHDMVSQEIPRWKLLFTWSPSEGVKVLQMEQLPHCHECEKPLKTD